jgi:hypothetical protein
MIDFIKTVFLSAYEGMHIFALMIKGGFDPFIEYKEERPQETIE